MQRPITIAGVSGSLREGSFNTAALQAAAELAPDGVTVTMHTLHGIPLFNEDVEAEGWPDAVAELREKVDPADGVLFATPEYNYSTPGVLKNAIDWLSRPTGKGVITGKPAAVIGASPGAFGTVRPGASAPGALLQYHADLLRRGSADHEGRRQGGGRPPGRRGQPRLREIPDREIRRLGAAASGRVENWSVGRAIDQTGSPSQSSCAWRTRRMKALPSPSIV
jgi:NAD(P)H-dependent FMN reductase